MNQDIEISKLSGVARALRSLADILDGAEAIKVRYNRQRADQGISGTPLNLGMVRGRLYASADQAESGVADKEALENGLADAWLFAKEFCDASWLTAQQAVVLYYANSDGG